MYLAVAVLQPDLQQRERDVWLWICRYRVHAEHRLLRHADGPALQLSWEVRMRGGRQRVRSCVRLLHRCLQRRLPPLRMLRVGHIVHWYRGLLRRAHVRHGAEMLQGGRPVLLERHRLLQR